MMKFPKLCAFAAGLISALGFAPLGLWPLTIVAFAVLIRLVNYAPTLRGAIARGYWFGAGYFIIGLNWIAGAFVFQDSMPVWFGWIAVVGLSLFLALYPAFASATAWLIGRGDARRFTLVFASSWMISEWLRATLLTGFAWNPVAVVLVDVPLIRDTARIFGTYGLSAWVTIGAGLLAFAAPRWIAAVRANTGNGTWLTYLIGPPIAVAGAAFLIAAGINRLDLFVYPEAQPASARQKLLRIVQPNIGQENKHKPAFDKINFDKLTALTGKPGAIPRLIMWPEAAIPDYLEDEEWARDRIAALMGPQDVLLTGGVALVEDKDGKIVAARNSLFALTADAQIVARYDKSHLVPGGEYLPLRSVMSAIGLSRLVPGDLDFLPGPGARSFALPGFGKMGVQICYEVIFSGHVVDAKNRPDFMFNPSNDAWFGSWGPPQHLAQARLRAIEEAMPVIRSTPTGISAVVNAQGKIMQRLPFQKPGFIEARLPPAAVPTLFAVYGNLLAFVFAFALGAVGVALGRLRR